MTVQNLPSRSIITWVNTRLFSFIRQNVMDLTRVFPIKHGLLMREFGEFWTVAHASDKYQLVRLFT